MDVVYLRAIMGLSVLKPRKNLKRELSIIITIGSIREATPKARKRIVSRAPITSSSSSTTCPLIEHSKTTTYRLNPEGQRVYATIRSDLVGFARADFPGEQPLDIDIPNLAL